MNEETRRRVFARGGYFCMVCGRPVSIENTPQVAHRIHKGVQAENHIMPYIWGKYGKDRNRKYVQENILENELNLVPVCSGKCNDACNIFFDPVKRDKLIDDILEKRGYKALK